jgi:hypothetical protein
MRYRVQIRYEGPLDAILLPASSVISYYVGINYSLRGPGIVVGIATGYVLDGLGLNLGGYEIFRTCPDRSRGPPSPMYNGYRVFPGVKSSWGVMLIPHPLLVSRS